ncbi:hypothetical protein [Mariprofundus sp. EBB-1]|uniref:hypothetical protein n=1 Tax=Mariprofundus sp. EBB-1 TaxID=2650971 RepID=UPI0011C46D44|nr:hypothetical protein [Mariprofundus sp. EBB-1]
MRVYDLWSLYAEEIYKRSVIMMGRVMDASKSPSLWLPDSDSAAMQCNQWHVCDGKAKSGTLAEAVTN